MKERRRNNELQSRRRTQTQHNHYHLSLNSERKKTRKMKKKCSLYLIQVRRKETNMIAEVGEQSQIPRATRAQSHGMGVGIGPTHLGTERGNLRLKNTEQHSHEMKSRNRERKDWMREGMLWEIPSPNPSSNRKEPHTTAANKITHIL